MFPLSNAVTVVENAARAGFAGLRTFVLARYSREYFEERYDDMGQTFDESVDSESSVCWNGCEYFRMLLGDESVTTPSEQVVTNQDDLNVFHNLRDGVYYLHFEGAECHYWVWVITGNSLYYCGTYGGVYKVVVKRFNKARYLTRFIRALQGSLTDYEYVFQVVAAVRRVSFVSVSFWRSDRYS